MDTPQEKISTSPGAGQTVKPWLEYFEGGEDQDGNTIETIFIVDEEYIVYDDGNQIVFQGDPPKSLQQRGIISRFNHLNFLTRSLRLTSLKEEARYRIGTAWANALFGSDEESPEESIEEIRAFIETKSKEVTKVTVVLFAFLVMLVLIAFSMGGYWIVNEDHKTLGAALVGGAFGAIGSLMSVLIRAKNLNVEPLASDWYLAAQGGIRIILGTLFGWFIVLLILSNLAFGQFADDPLAVYCMAVIAGFLEKLVPDLMKNVANNGENDS